MKGSTIIATVMTILIFLSSTSLAIEINWCLVDNHNPVQMHRGWSHGSTIIGGAGIKAQYSSFTGRQTSVIPWSRLLEWRQSKPYIHCVYEYDMPRYSYGSPTGEYYIRNMEISFEFHSDPKKHPFGSDFNNVVSVFRQYAADKER